METKVNNGGEQQPIDEEGRYTFKSFQSPKKSGLTKMNFMGKTIYNHKNGYIEETNKGYRVSKLFAFGKDKEFESFDGAYNFLTSESSSTFSKKDEKKTDYKAQNKKLMLEKGLSDTDRKFIYREIDDYLSENLVDDSLDATIDIGDYTVSFNGWVGDDGFYEYEIKSIDNYQKDMLDLLKEKGIKYDISSISKSIYFEKNGETYRISDHKRPLQEGFYDPTSNITHNIIVKDNKERYYKLKNILEV